MLITDAGQALLARALRGDTLTFTAVQMGDGAITTQTMASMSALVNRIIDSQMEQKFFDDCPITFRDIRQTKLVLIERLKSIYHTRIQYPEQQKETNNRTV